MTLPFSFPQTLADSSLRSAALKHASAAANNAATRSTRAPLPYQVTRY
jgi:hypothetical protein